MTLLAQHEDGEIHHCTWEALAEIAKARGGVDAVVTDCPYSARTHAGHDGAVAQVGEGGVMQNVLDYSAWSADDVARFVEAWAPLTRGWIVSLTDHVLVPAWESAYGNAGRYAFQPLPCVMRGMTVRVVGDGPSSWAVQAMVCRPRSREWAKWGTLDGAYVGPREQPKVTGGKPLWLMRALIRDYTRPGDLVVDPCAGGFTTALACRLEGRRFLCGDALREHCDIGVERLSALPTQDRAGTLSLFGKVGT